MRRGEGAAGKLGALHGGSAGAVKCLQHLERSQAAMGEQAAIQVLRERYASLSLRERQVMTLVVQGRLNKLIGTELGISEITVKAHRGRVMRKMDADSLPALVHMAATLGLTRSTARVRLSDLNCQSPIFASGNYAAHRLRDDSVLSAAGWRRSGPSIAMR